MSNFKIIQLDKTDSTNNYASALLSDKKSACNTVVTAKLQEKGKGQGSNQWQSEYGKNLLCSIIICPGFINAFDQFRLSKVSSLAIRDCLADLGVSTVIKWPNDILTAGKKIAGILIENSLLRDMITSSVIGIGINVNQETFEDMPLKAASVLQETLKSNDLNHVLKLLLDKFELWYSMLESNEADEIDKEYLKSLYGLNTFLPFRKGNVSFDAMITGVEESGELFLRRRDGKLLKVVFREIEYL